MEIYLKRYFWVVPILVILTSSVLAARAANHILEAKVFANGGAPRTTRASRAPKHDVQKPPPSKDASEVVTRNMFCSSCEPAAAAAGNQPAQVVDENHPPSTSLPLVLLATIVAADPGASGATIVNTASAKSGQYSVGDVIPDAGEVRKIRPKFVDFFNKNANRLERIDLGGVPGAPPPVAAAAPPPPPPPSGGEQTGNDGEAALMAAVDKGVKRIDDSHWDIERGVVDKVLTDPSAIMRQARIVPSIKDGKPNGFKMYAIRPNSVYAKIGLQNGDTIQSINGFEITSMDKAMEIYTKLRSASNISVSVMRRGQAQQLDYSIK
jgi:general secretion pathway protein C